MGAVAGGFVGGSWGLGLGAPRDLRPPRPPARHCTQRTPSRRAARPPSRDSWNGTAACNAAAPSAQPRTPAALGNAPHLLEHRTLGAGYARAARDHVKGPPVPGPEQEAPAPT